MASSSEDFEDLYGEERDIIKAPVRPAEKLVEYVLPSTGEKMSVHVVGHHVLWGNYLWNGAHWMSDHVDAHPEEFVGKSVLELGAGAGLPSILAARAGARYVLCTDYPDEELILNIQKNIQTLIPEQCRRACEALGYLWGAPAADLLARNAGRKYDVLILCDVIFNHSEHRKLLQSIADLLDPEGVAWCVFSHYRPWYMDRDLALLTLAKEWGLECILVEEHKYDSIVNDFRDDRADPDILRTVFAYKIVFCRGSKGAHESA